MRVPPGKKRISPQEGTGIEGERGTSGEGRHDSGMFEENGRGFSFRNLRNCFLTAAERRDERKIFRCARDFIRPIAADAKEWNGNTQRVQGHGHDVVASGYIIMIQSLNPLQHWLGNGILMNPVASHWKSVQARIETDGLQ